MNRKVLLAIVIFISLSLVIGFRYIDDRNVNLRGSNISNNIEFKFDKSISKIEERYTLVLDKSISVGSNIKELENSYFDFKIELLESKAKIYINKLFKNFNTNILYEEIYVDQIIEYINKVLNLQVDFLKLKNNIITSYEKIRDIENVETVDKIVNFSGCNGKIFKIHIFEENNMLILEIEENNNEI